jgi:hypothetical protein
VAAFKSRYVLSTVLLTYACRLLARGHHAR